MATTFLFPNNNPLLAVKIARNEMGSEFANIFRGFAQDQARRVIEVSGVADVTDSTTGTAASALVAQTLPALYDGASSGASPAAALNTALGAFENCGGAFGQFLNRIRARLGLPLLTWGTASFTAGTLPAQTKALTATSGATAADYTTGVDRLTTARNNVATIVKAVNEVLTAIGEPTLTDNTGGTASLTYALGTIADLDAGTGTPAGTTSISDTAVDAFLLAQANNLATLAKTVNAALFQTGLGELTDNLSGTVSDTLAAMTIPPAYTTAGTDCAPAAGFDTAIGVIANNLSDLATRVNLLLERFNFAAITNSSGGSADETLATHSVDLTAVTGTTACVDVTAATDRCNAIRNGLASLAAKVNLVAPYFGSTLLTDSTGGTASGAIGVIATSTGTGNDGTADQTMADTTVDAFLLAAKNAESSLAGKLNELTGTEVGTKPLKVVAVL